MRTTLVSVGTAGDVAPVAALGAELRHRGHEVRVAVLDPWADLVTAQDLEAVPLGMGSSAMWPDNPALRRLAVAQPGAMYLAMRASLARSAGRLTGVLQRACAGSDVVVSGLVTADATASLSQRMGFVPVTVLFAPLLPSADPGLGTLVPPPLPGLPGGGPLPDPVPDAARLAVARGMWSLARGLGAATNRRATGRVLPPRTAHRHPLLLATSPLLAPHGPGAGRWWPGGVHQTGRLEPVAAPPPLPGWLDDWLRRHPDAVLMDFGSIATSHPRADIELFRATARRAGVPLLLQTPLLPEGVLPDTDTDTHTDPDAGGAGMAVANAGPVDHRSLVPRLAGVVHHGGAGTTATVLAAGRPAVVVPHLGDQAWWGRRVEALGAGVLAGPRWRMHPALLARSLRRALACRAQAGEIGVRLRAEHGTRAAADLLEHLAAGRGHA